MSTVSETRARRERLRNPPNGIMSSELDVVCCSATQRGRDAAAQREWNEKRRKKLFESRRRLLIDRWSRYFSTDDQVITMSGKWPGRPTLNRIMASVCHYFALDAIDLRSPKRHANLLLPRQIFYFLARKLTYSSLPSIGRYCNRHHTTVLHAVRKIGARMLYDPNLVVEIDAIKAQIRGEHQ